MNNTLNELPFANLTDDKIKRLFGLCELQNCDLISSCDLFNNILESPDSNEELNLLSNGAGLNIESKYYNIKQTSKCFEKVNGNGISIIHCNTRSLPKNYDTLKDILDSFKEQPSVIAISETKLKEDNIHNLSILGYNFVSTHSLSNAGGVGIYISEKIKFIRRQDLDFISQDYESCFVELPRNKQKNILVGCVSRHPSNNCTIFKEVLSEKLNQINRLGFETYIAGDININLFNYNSNEPTSEYLDMLFDLGFLPIITKATRITYHTSTLIDHIYTNTPEKIVQSGICLVDISDHLPCFCTATTKLPNIIHKKYYRDFSNFDSNHFSDDLRKIDFKAIVNEDVNKSMNNLTNLLLEITNKHAPIRKVTNKKKKQLKRPWITKGILSSIKKRQKLFKSHFLSSDIQTRKEYKIYRNKLIKLKSIAKRDYFESQFLNYKSNIKMTWTYRYTNK